MHGYKNLTFSFQENHTFFVVGLLKNIFCGKTDGKRQQTNCVVHREWRDKQTDSADFLFFISLKKNLFRLTFPSWSSTWAQEQLARSPLLWPPGARPFEEQPSPHHPPRLLQSANHRESSCSFWHCFKICRRVHIRIHTHARTYTAPLAVYASTSIGTALETTSLSGQNIYFQISRYQSAANEQCWDGGQTWSINRASITDR